MKYSHQTNIYSFDDSSPTAFWHHLLHVEISMVQQKNPRALTMLLIWNGNRSAGKKVYTYLGFTSEAVSGVLLLCFQVVTCFALFFGYA